MLHGSNGESAHIMANSTHAEHACIAQTLLHFVSEMLGNVITKRNLLQRLTTPTIVARVVLISTEGRRNRKKSDQPQALAPLNIREFASLHCSLPLLF